MTVPETPSPDILTVNKEMPLSRCAYGRVTVLLDAQSLQF
jgi:hypothetical protein